MDPADINTREQLAGALNQLRHDRGLSLRGLASTAAKLPDRNGRPPALPRMTASDLINAKSVPEVETLTTFLAVCAIHGEAQQPWLQARDRVANQHQHRPPGAVRVRDARPRLLGVTASIQVDQLSGGSQSEPGNNEELPLYVPRDLDADLRTKLTVAGQRGGMVLLVGTSAVGKTRTLFEAVRAVLPDWWLLHPANSEDLQEFATNAVGRTVLWLDELQDYLDHADGVPAGRVRALIEAGVVLVATCWPAERNKRSALPGHGQPDPYANDRRLLNLAEVLHVPSAFSEHERRRAEDLADSDPRLRVALDTAETGITQVLSGGPELIRRWDEAPAYAKAIITAGLDARRVGAHAPLTREHLKDAAPGYLSEREKATAPTEWLEEALGYATVLLHGATAVLNPVSVDMGRIAGYKVDDYLYQHALGARRTVHLPDAAWRALTSHHHFDDTRRLADSALRRGRIDEAVILLSRVSGSRDDVATHSLMSLLENEGKVQDLRTLADSGIWAACRWLAKWLVENLLYGELFDRADHGDEAAVNELKALLDRGDKNFAPDMASWLSERGGVEVLRASAEVDNSLAASQLTWLLAWNGNIDELRTRADGGDRSAARHLADWLAKNGQLEELQTRADKGDSTASYWLTKDEEIGAQADEMLKWRLIKSGKIDDLRTLADEGNQSAASTLAMFLAAENEIEELRTRASGGDSSASDELSQWLFWNGKFNELGTRAEEGDWSARSCLRAWTTSSGIIEGLIDNIDIDVDAGDQIAGSFDLAWWMGDEFPQVKDFLARSNGGDHSAIPELVQWLEEIGQLEKLRAAADGETHLNSSARFAWLLARGGRIEELSVRAHGKDGAASIQLARWLARNGKFEELHDRFGKLLEFPYLLARHGGIEQLRAHADGGEFQSCSVLAEWLVRNDKIEELCACVEKGYHNSDRGVLWWIEHNEPSEKLIQLLRPFVGCDNAIIEFAFTNLLSKLGRVDELGREVAAGTYGAVEALGVAQINR